jgi:glucose/arabinose dehydrogenase
MRRVILLPALALLACAPERVPQPPADNGPPEEPVRLALQQVAGGLQRPVYLTSPPGDPRLFVLEQAGRIRIIRDGQLVQQPFLDITAQVTNLGGMGDERGLLGLAFHPQYATNGFFYVNYTDGSGNTRVERYTRSANPDVAEPGSARLIIGIGQPFGNHNGGQLLFGPDGMLYIATGDGGGGGDPQNNAQRLVNLLGKILRIDVNAGDPYAIPPDNPFVGQTDARPEIWAYGLRNPWRNAFDRGSNTFFIADVGQNREEEINAVPSSAAGLNFGWRIMEGRSCFNPATNCDQSGLTMPVHTYPTSGGNCAVTGGFVYRGSAIPQIAGRYFFSDYCRGGLRSLRVVNGTAQDVREWDVGSTGSVSSFGEDANGELYVLAHGGTIYRIVRAQ